MAFHLQVENTSCFPWKMNAVLFLLYQELEIHVEKSNTHKDSVRSHDSE